MSELEIKQHITQAIKQMSLVQQKKLLAFIQSMLGIRKPSQPNGILQFAGIFDAQDSREFKAALKDCEQIDHDGW